MNGELSEVFRAHLRSAWERARRTWPGVYVDEEPFVAYVAERWPEAEAPDPTLSALNTGDLYLACAYLKGCPDAARALEERYLRLVPNMVAKMDLSETQRAIVLDQVRTKLLLPPEGEEQLGLAAYSGKGALMAWLRVVAVRTALRLVDRVEHRRHADEEVALVQLGDDPEMACIKGRYRAAFAEAARAAFGALSSDERTLLRMRVLDNLEIAAIGIALGTPRSTIHRHLMQARQRVLSLTRQGLQERLLLTPSQATSLVGFLQSQLDLDLPEILRASGGE